MRYLVCYISLMPSQSKIGNFKASLSLCLDGGGWISSRRLELLAAIGHTNSISRGEKAVGMTYRGAWIAVEEMNSRAGVPLVKSRHGGSGGGGAELTEVGLQLVFEMSRLTELQAQFFQSVAIFDNNQEERWAIFKNCYRNLNEDECA